MWRAWSAAIAVIGLLGGLAPGQTPKGKDGDDDNKQTVTFETADDVRITGTFFKGKKGIESPAVIIVTRFNSDRTAKGIAGLAEELQNKMNCAVLTFDLRGHGGSKVVRDRFWNYDQNRNGIRGGNAARTKSEISASEFKPSYWSMTLNDLAAARFFIDQQNDAQRCNSSSLFVIACQESAGMAMGWATHEWERKVVPNTATIGSLNPQARMPGEDLAGCVWLGPVTRGGSVTFRATEWFNRASKLRDNTPMCFIYGKQDSASASVVPSLFSAIKRSPEGKRDKHTLDKDEGLATRLPGQDLLGPGAASLNVNEKILAYIAGVLKDRKNTVWKSMDSGRPQMFPLAALNLQQPG